MYGIQNGSSSFQGNQYEVVTNKSEAPNQEQLAEMIGISVDTLNNYKKLTENVEDFLGEDCTKADVMQWMISHQDARRNLTPGELIFANSMVAEEIALENKEKMLEGTYNSHDARKNDGCVQMDTPKTVLKERDYSTNTRQQVAKISGVGTGTVARYDAIMKTDDEELKKQKKE